MIPIAEQVYTSAPKLLDGHSSHLGVVAQTRALPQELNAEFANHRAYSLLPETVEGKLNPPRFVLTRSRSKKQLLLSRVCYGGADHTGRTAPFAHHMAIEQASLAAANLTFAQVAAAAENLFHQRWDQPAAWIEPARQLPNSPEAHLADCWAKIIPAERQPAMLASMAETLWRFGKQQRPLVVCVPKAHAEHVLEMAVNLVQLLPPSSQQEMSIASHVVQQSDYLRDATLIFTYAETEYLQSCQARQDPHRPVIVNLCSPAVQATEKLGPYGTLLQKFWEKHGFERLVNHLPWVETWKLEESQFPLFLEALLVQQTLKQPIKSEQRDKLSALVDQISKDERYKSLLFDWVSSYCSLLPANDRGTAQTLAHLAADSRWPQEARQKFLAVIAQHWRPWAPVIWAELKAQPHLAANLQQGLQAFANPAFATVSFQQALTIADPKFADFITPWLSSQPLTFETLQDMLLQLGPQSLQQLPALRPVLLQHLRQTVQSEAESAKLIQLARTAPAGTDSRALIAEFYRQNLEQKPQRLSPLVWAEGCWQLAIDSSSPNAALQVLRWLQQTPGLRITPAMALRWRQMLPGTIHESSCAPLLEAIAAPPPNVNSEANNQAEPAEFSEFVSKSTRPIGRALPAFRAITTGRLFLCLCTVLLACSIYFGLKQDPRFGAFEFTPEIRRILIPVISTAAFVFLVAWGVTYLRPTRWARVTHQIRRWLAFVLLGIAAVPLVWLAI